MKKPVLFAILAICICLNASIYASAYQAEVENISSRNYFQPVLNAINNAKESILIGMYIISLPAAEETGGGVRQLLDAIINAKKRGIAVRVILEYHRLEDFTPKGLNYYAYHYLKDNGIDVHFDESSANCLHLKTIVIDKELVITGSSNWSEAAFKASYETNLMIRSRPLALEIIKELDSIPLRIEPPKTITNAFDIPNSFCDSKFGALRKMVNTNDLRPLDIILFLWGERNNSISCESIAVCLNIINKMDQTGWRRQIKRSLKKLEERYKLIKYEWQFGRDEIKIELLSYPGEAPIAFPMDYFKYNWGTRLSLAGKAVLITMCAELRSLTGNVLSLPISYLSKRYGMTEKEYSKGIKELRRYNIIKVQYGRGIKNRETTKINILAVYDMDDYNEEIETLNTRYGKDLINKAAELAEIIYCAYDINIIKDILDKIDVYGRGPVIEAFGYVKNMTVDNSKRSYNYVLGILRKRSAKSFFTPPHQ